MAHAWPPNDAERADWDRREAAFRHRIGALESSVAEARAEATAAREVAETKATEAEVAKEVAAKHKARAMELRRIVEFYAGSPSSVRRDGGRKAREAL